MKQPEPISYATQYKMVVLDDPKQLIMNKGIQCIDGGTATINGKLEKFAVRYDNKPDLAAQIAAWQADWAAYKAWQAAEFARNVPGLVELRAATEAAYNEQSRYDAEFERMMSRGTGIAPRPINKALEMQASELAAQYPRAALYLRAKGYTSANNVDKYGAGKRAMELIAQGGDLDAAEAILKNWLPESAYND